MFEDMSNATFGWLLYLIGLPIVMIGLWSIICFFIVRFGDQPFNTMLFLTGCGACCVPGLNAMILLVAIIASACEGCKILGDYIKDWYADMDINLQSFDKRITNCIQGKHDTEQQA